MFITIICVILMEMRPKIQNRSNRYSIKKPEQIFLSPQVKQSVIISNKHGIFEMPQESLEIRKYQENQKLHRIIA